MEVGSTVERARCTCKLIAAREILEIIRQISPRRRNSSSSSRPGNQRRSATRKEAYLVIEKDHETSRRMEVYDNEQ